MTPLSGPRQGGGHSTPLTILLEQGRSPQEEGGTEPRRAEHTGPRPVGLSEAKKAHPQAAISRLFLLFGHAARLFQDAANRLKGLHHSG